MTFYNFQRRHLLTSKNTIYIIWFIGVLLGSLLYFNTDHVNLILIESSLNRGSSVCDTLSVTLLPVFISTLLFYISRNLLFLFCFIKSFSFGFCFCTISDTFNASYWMIRYLMLFSGSCMCILLLFFWIRLFTRYHKSVVVETVVFSSIFVIISLLDLFYITPFLRSFTITR